MSDREKLEIAMRALRWYAHPDHWREDSWNVPSVIQAPDYGKPGAKARNALKRIGSARSRSRGKE